MASVQNLVDTPLRAPCSFICCSYCSLCHLEILLWIYVMTSDISIPIWLWHLWSVLGNSWMSPLHPCLLPLAGSPATLRWGFTTSLPLAHFFTLVFFFFWALVYIFSTSRSYSFNCFYLRLISSVEFFTYLFRCKYFVWNCLVCKKLNTRHFIWKIAEALGDTSFL
jgi:hypothetical protein